MGRELVRHIWCSIGSKAPAVILAMMDRRSAVSSVDWFMRPGAASSRKPITEPDKNQLSIKVKVRENQLSIKVKPDKNQLSTKVKAGENQFP